MVAFYSGKGSLTMLEILKMLAQAVLEGGHGGIVAILLGVIAGLCFVIWMLWKSNQKKDEKIEKIQEKIQQDYQKVLDDYHKGNLTVVEVINGLKMVLIEIKAKI